MFMKTSDNFMAMKHFVHFERAYCIHIGRDDRNTRPFHAILENNLSGE
jgi:hypothetical protein